MDIMYDPSTGKIKSYVCEQDDDWREVAIKNLELRIAELEAALQKINRIIDHPGRFHGDIQATLDLVIDTLDTKFI